MVSSCDTLMRMGGTHVVDLAITTITEKNNQVMVNVTACSTRVRICTPMTSPKKINERYKTTMAACQ